MNNPPDRKSTLLSESFHEDWAQGAPHGFARQAAAAARRRGTRRRAIGTAAGALVAAAAMILARAPARHAPGPAPPPRPAAYEVISDDELLADLRDRPLLVIGPPSRTRQFVVLGP